MIYNCKSTSKGFNCMYNIKKYFNHYLYKILSVLKIKSIDDNKKIESEIIINSEKINQNAEKIMSEYGNNVLRLAYSYLHNLSDAEDVLQDTLIQYLKTQPNFESDEHEKAWILRVAINISKNKINYNKIRMTDELSEKLSHKEDEDLSFIWDTVKELPEKYREVIHLYYHEGYSINEVANILSKNESTIRSLLYRGRSKLKDILKEVYDFE